MGDWRCFPHLSLHTGMGSLKTLCTDLTDCDCKEEDQPDMHQGHGPLKKGSDGKEACKPEDQGGADGHPWCPADCSHWGSRSLDAPLCWACSCGTIACSHFRRGRACRSELCFHPLCMFSCAPWILWMLNGHIYSIHLGIFSLQNRNKILKTSATRHYKICFSNRQIKFHLTLQFYCVCVCVCVCVCAEFFFFNFKKCLSLASSQNVKHIITLWPSISSPRYTYKRAKNNVLAKTLCPLKKMLIAALFKIVKK